MSRAVIFDIDGTLADVEHRRPFLPNWGKFFGAMHLDPVIEPVAELANIIYEYSRSQLDDAYINVIVVTARPADYLDVTKLWLDSNHIRYDAIYFRNKGDYREDSIVKRELLQQILDDGFEPFLVVDDRPQVVKMWREFGLTCLQCAPDEILPKHDGKQLLDLMVGPSGAGKSTYVAKNYAAHEVISTDAIREQLWGSRSADAAFTPEGLKRTFALAHALTRARLEVGERTVFDATNLKKADRAKVLACMPRGQYARFIVIDRDYDDKMASRNWRSEELVHKHHKAFHANLKDILAGDGHPSVVVLDRR